MQKKIIALAIAGLASTAAFAQSNVTIYGVADATFDSIKTSGSVEPRHNRISTNSSLIGFKGAEDLGNGLKAVFQFESGVSFDQAGGLSTSRDSYVGVAGGFGTIVAGNLTGPTRAFGAAVDVFAGATGIGANSGIIGKFGGMLEGVSTDGVTGSATTVQPGRSATAASIFDSRWKNSIAYISPTFAGVTVIGAYVANENKSATNNTYGYDVGVKYAAGPVLVGLSYNRANVNNDVGITFASNIGAAAGAASDVTASNVRLVASFDAGVVKINGLAERVKVSADTVNLGSFSETQKVYGLGAAVPVGKGKIVGQYYIARDISGVDDTGAKLWAVGYEHSLSKRTILKATYARLSNDNLADLNFGVNGNQNAAGETGSGFQVGVRHSF